jgi:hypothetical protein
MSEDEIPEVVDIEPTRHMQIKDHRLLVMIFGSVIIASLLVLVALSLYASTGASQLDLSRPGYVDIRSQAKNDDSFVGFSPSGELDAEALEEFEKLYAQKLTELETVDPFKKDVLSPESLQIK